MKKQSKLELAIAAFKKAGGILTMSEAMKVGIHRRELYALRDSGDLEVISRGLYRLTDMPDLSLPDFVPVAKKIPNGRYLPHFRSRISRNNNPNPPFRLCCIAKSGT